MEIKLRAWDEGNKVMHHNFQFISSYVPNDESEGSDWIIFISDKFPLENKETNPFDNPNPFFKEQLKIMQYTGLKDKNGVEIYEGDIVNSRSSWTGINLTGEVVYEDAAFRIGDNIKTSTLVCNTYNMEIIGNIYENPELMT